jgi:hypothetical protein
MSTLELYTFFLKLRKAVAAGKKTLADFQGRHYKRTDPRASEGIRQ